MINWFLSLPGWGQVLLALLVIVIVCRAVIWVILFGIGVVIGCSYSRAFRRDLPRNAPTYRRRYR